MHAHTSKPAARANDKARFRGGGIELKITGYLKFTQDLARRGRKDYLGGSICYLCVLLALTQSEKISHSTACADFSVSRQMSRIIVQHTEGARKLRINLPKLLRAVGVNLVKKTLSKANSIIFFCTR